MHHAVEYHAMTHLQLILLLTQWLFTNAYTVPVCVEYQMRSTMYSILNGLLKSAYPVLVDVEYDCQCSKYSILNGFVKNACTEWLWALGALGV